MKIQKIKIKDFKIIKDLDKEINGANILLVGDNGVGKSTVIQFIEIALGKNNNIPPNAEGEGEIVTTKDGQEYKFQVKFKDGKPQVTITAPNGMRDNRKSALAQLVGAIDFDVDEFVGLSATVPGRRKQVEIYKSLLPVEVIEELGKHEHNIKMAFDDRTELNRKITMLKGFVKESKLFGDDLKIQPVDISDIQANISAANAVNEKINKVKSGLDQRGVKITALNDEHRKLLMRLEEIENETTVLNKEIQDGNDWLAKNPSIDTAPLFDQINSVSEQNAKYAEAQQILDKQKQIETLESEVGEFTALIETSKQAIQDAIKDFASPVAGLTFDAENLIYNDVVVSDTTLSTSEIIHLGCKLKMAQNKEFGVLLIEHGESIGTKRLTEIQEMAKSHDWQIIMEQVERGSEELRIELMADQPVTA